MATLLSRERAIDHDVHPAIPRDVLRWALLADKVFVGFNAVGGVRLMINGLGSPQPALPHSPFDRFTM